MAVTLPLPTSNLASSGATATEPYSSRLCPPISPHAASGPWSSTKIGERGSSEGKTQTPVVRGRSVSSSGFEFRGSAKQAHDLSNRPHREITPWKRGGWPRSEVVRDSDRSTCALRWMRRFVEMITCFRPSLRKQGACHARVLGILSQRLEGVGREVGVFRHVSPHLTPLLTTLVVYGLEPREA